MYLVVYSIYRREEEAPFEYCIVPWDVSVNPPIILPIISRHDSLAKARAQIPWGKVCFAKEKDDHPSLLETWI